MSLKNRKHIPSLHLDERKFVEIRPVTQIEVSSTFHPQVFGQTVVPDVILVSTDGVQFFVHSAILHAASTSSFGHLIPSPQIDCRAKCMVHPVQEDAVTLNVILHVIYGLNIQRYSPALPTLIRAINHLEDKYGVPLDRFLLPGASLVGVLLTHAAGGPGAALDVYTLAARHRLQSLAVATSEHLHGLDISSVTEQQAEQIGGVYLKWLVLLLLERVDAVKHFLVVAPILHAPTTICGFAEQQRDVSGPWALTVSQLLTEVRPDIPTALLELRLNPLAYRCMCEECRTAIQNRIRGLAVEWIGVRRTI